MRLRRCAVLFVEARESVAFDLASLLRGGAGLHRRRAWVALAPHLDSELELDLADLPLLGQVSPTEWVERAQLADHADDAIERALERGLLIGDDPRSAAFRERDEALRSAHWWPAAAVAHWASRWQGIDGVTAMERNGMVSAPDLRRKLGAPPPEVQEVDSGLARIPLPRLDDGAFEAMLARRVTCRNYDAARTLPHALFLRMLQRVLMARATLRVQDDTVFLKKNVPSAGGLHPTEAYLLVRRVEGIEPGLYHYHPVEHALSPLSCPGPDIDAFARLALAGQHWFADAHVLVLLAPRFNRTFWKYRQHAKAYRALTLDVGHISQALYFSATDLGLGAFVTSAINDVDLGKALGLDPMRQSVMAICGFGWRSEHAATTEFDPACDVWAAGSASRQA
ncbi:MULTISPECIES: putative peptide maturation dehydrogenase [unclassified Xanthomonas]|uniref:putative peptide maturation dehydrogenase n=1 Tax=Xanthomonas sp. LMG 9002 TaxID=1591158 RepID=UPI00136FBFA4|nr:putative peptide maturation dehydrogenase [Xanthomonas sp. LMG 9002]MXV05776.1 putative peptide maturation dehydrogenase [Xanthomonas sp. LMG 9002]